MNARLLLALGALCVLAGCATNQQKYNWGKYDPSLYDYYKDPTKVAELDASLGAIVKAADANTALVPPGIYAEYGYLKLQQGNNALAIDLFKQEEARWPEAKVFMDRMIKVASMPSPASKGGSP